MLLKRCYRFYNFVVNMYLYVVCNNPQPGSCSSLLSILQQQLNLLGLLVAKIQQQALPKQSRNIPHICLYKNPSPLLQLIVLTVSAPSPFFKHILLTVPAPSPLLQLTVLTVSAPSLFRAHTSNSVSLLLILRPLTSNSASPPSPPPLSCFGKCGFKQAYNLDFYEGNSLQCCSTLLESAYSGVVHCQKQPVVVQYTLLETSYSGVVHCQKQPVVVQCTVTQCILHIDQLYAQCTEKKNEIMYEITKTIQ